MGKEEYPLEQPLALLVLNPLSGSSNPNLVRARFEEVFGAAGWSTRSYSITPREALCGAVKQALAEGASLVAAAGGDGTVSEVGSALAFSGVPLGILPTGTWNAMAHNLGIPMLLDDALRLLIEEHQLINMDALKINERLYLLNMGIGMSANVMQSTPQHQKRRFGPLAYFWNFLAQASGLRLQPFRLEVDGIQKLVKVSELMVVNSSILGWGEMPTALDIYPDDGRVEIIGICAPNLLGFLRIGLNFLIGRRKNAPGFISFSAERSIKISTRRRLVVEADGDIIGSTPVQITVVPSAVQVIAPRARLSPINAAWAKMIEYPKITLKEPANESTGESSHA